MDNKLPLISYTLAALSGIFFMGGLVILSSEGGKEHEPNRGNIDGTGYVVRE